MLNNSNKVKSYKIGRSGNSTKIVPVPKLWLEDNRIEVSSKIDMHRIAIDGKDCLVIVKSGGKK